MIDLYVDDFCKNGCDDFEPHVTKYGAGTTGCCTYIRCKHSSRCHNLLDYLQELQAKQTKNEKAENLKNQLFKLMKKEGGDSHG